MKRLPVLVLVGGMVGCDNSKPNDPSIKAERTVVQPGGGVRVGPVGGGYEHGAKQDRYEGPASKAPGWAKQVGMPPVLYYAE
jgi:hypothetical protein